MIKFKFFRFVAKYISLSTYRKILEFIKYYVGGLLHRLDEHHIFLSGGGIAFSLVLSLIPLVLIVFSVLGSVINIASIEEQIILLIDTIIPYPQAAAYTKEVILSRIPDVVGYKTLAAYIGAFGLFFTSTWLFSSMRTILNRIFGVTEHKPALIGLLRDFGMVILLIILILMSTFILPTLNILIEAADRIPFLKYFQISGFSDFIFSTISTLIVFLMFYMFYLLIPYEKLGRRVPLISAFWATIFWEIARSLFGYYVANFLRVNAIYGAFILIIVVLFWLFYSSCLFIMAAEIGQLYRERKLKFAKNNDTFL